MERKTIMAIVMLSFIVVVIILAIASLNLASTAGQQKHVEKTPNKDLPLGNGAVTNIWIDSYARLDVLKDNGVKYLFVDIGGTAQNGSFTTPEHEIAHFLNFIKEYEKDTGYDFVLLPYSEVMSYKIDVTNKEFQQNYASSYKHLNNIGFDGILIDIEPVRFNQRSSYLDLIDKLRSSLPKSSIIAVYAVSMSDPKSNNEWAWEPKYYMKVADKVDLVSAAIYDTDILDENQYRNYVRNQVSKISSREWRSMFLIGIPTHKPFPETSHTALSVYYDELKKHPDHPFIGATIFAEWTAKESDWDYLNIPLSSASYGRG